MGGATTAVPLEGIGALYWNPAVISGLPSSEMGFGADLLSAVMELSSSSGPSAGATQGTPGWTLIPNIGWIHRGADSKLTFGLGIHSVAGFKTNYPSSFTNPILTPQPNGVGRLYSEAQFAQISPAASYQLTDRLAVAVGPMVTLGAVVADPLLFIAPNPNGYPTGRGTQLNLAVALRAVCSIRATVTGTSAPRSRARSGCRSFNTRPKTRRVDPVTVRSASICR